jgi:membrane-bound lytic murein transglycosylase A
MAPEEIPDLADDLSRRDLAPALESSLRYYAKLPPQTTFTLGPDVYTARHLKESVEAFRSLLGEPEGVFTKRLKRDFYVYTVGGSTPVVFSAYYEHTLAAGLTPTPEYAYPLYAPPPAPDRYSRDEIDRRGALRGKGLEIAWARDPVDVFFLQVQGSGWLTLPEGDRVRVRFAAHNGRDYISVGRRLLDEGYIPRENFSRSVLVDFLHSQRDQGLRFLAWNPRYVYFSLDRGPGADHALGSLGEPLTPYRSVALDPAVYPRGALVYLDAPGDPPVARWALNQDQGGAIKGIYRLDYFAGRGHEAEDFAVKFWRPGRVLVFILRLNRRMD